MTDYTDVRQELHVASGINSHCIGIPPGGLGDETQPISLRDMSGAYKRSKFLAEAEVQRLIQEKGLPAVIVNPSTPIGPRDIKPTPTGRIIVDAASGRMPAYVDTGLNLVHVDDVAQGHLMAYEYGKVGERYILGGENLTLKKILTEIAKITNQKGEDILPEWKAVAKGCRDKQVEQIFKDAVPGILWPSDFKLARSNVSSY